MSRRIKYTKESKAKDENEERVAETKTKAKKGKKITKKKKFTD